MKNLTILDCTLRDGGYYNDWNFSKDFIILLINSGMKIAFIMLYNRYIIALSDYSTVYQIFID